ncbi:MAG: hypothetical protein LPK25_04105 [Cyclobacteriaceae bacterium]|nr:hypothetical protein [Cyclobacteriaceae bacterium]MDX5465937.1 hypothetical protein [Cyclobacteriaceae bacterium]
MASQDKVLTPELVRIIKIFLFSSFGLVLIFSFFNTYRADNTQKDKTFQVSDSARLFFLNLRAIHYDREIRRDAGMTLFRPGDRNQSETEPTLIPAILLNPNKEEAYIFWELKNVEFPVEILAFKHQDSVMLSLDQGNNLVHFKFFNQIKPLIQEDYSFEILSGGKKYPIWTSEQENEALKTLVEDYLRLLNQPD